MLEPEDFMPGVRVKDGRCIDSILVAFDDTGDLAAMNTSPRRAPYPYGVKGDVDVSRRAAENV